MIAWKGILCDILRIIRTELKYWNTWHNTVTYYGILLRDFIRYYSHSQHFRKTIVLNPNPCDDEKYTFQGPGIECEKGITCSISWIYSLKLKENFHWHFYVRNKSCQHNLIQFRIKCSIFCSREVYHELALVYFIVFRLQNGLRSWYRCIVRSNCISPVI